MVLIFKISKDTGGKYCGNKLIVHDHSEYAHAVFIHPASGRDRDRELGTQKYTHIIHTYIM
jgi:hypothetical protein